MFAKGNFSNTQSQESVLRSNDYLVCIIDDIGLTMT